jgi:hypothetical protein
LKVLERNIGYSIYELRAGLVSRGIIIYAEGVLV